MSGGRSWKPGCSTGGALLNVVRGMFSLTFRIYTKENWLAYGVDVLSECIFLSPRLRVGVDSFQQSSRVFELGGGGTEIPPPCHGAWTSGAYLVGNHVWVIEAMCTV